MQQFGCPSGTQSAYALAYSSEKDKQFLEDKEPPPEVLEMMKKQFSVASSKKPTSKKRQGGLGNYEVVQCGSSGHNVRSKPGLNGSPVGRLVKNSKIEAVEEVRCTILSHVTSLAQCTLILCMFTVQLVLIARFSGAWKCNKTYTHNEWPIPLVANAIIINF